MGLYKTNKLAKTHTIIECPVCHTKFEKIQYSQAFCCSKCKDKFHNTHTGDRHKNPDYYQNYNIKHPERLERIGIYDMSGCGDFGYYDEDGEPHLFSDDARCAAMCDNPIEGR